MTVIFITMSQGAITIKHYGLLMYGELTEYIVTLCVYCQPGLAKCTSLLSYLIFSFFNDSRLLTPKYSQYFTGSAPPILYSWSNSPIGCSAPLYSWSSSLIGSAYYFLYISFCFGFNKAVTNLTLLRQHNLQYITAESIY